MAYIRKLPSGKWQATVRHPNGTRPSKTDVLKKVVAEWAKEEEAKYARGDLRDPRAGRILVGEWYTRWIAARGVDAATKRRIESCWATHCNAQWARWPMDAITRMEAQEWARAVEKKRRARDRGREAEEDAPVIAAATVHSIVQVMSSLYDAAVHERPPIVLTNPFSDLDLPTIPPAPVDYLEHDEADALVAELEKNHGPQWAAYVETGLWVGLRLGEMNGLLGDRVSWLRHRIEVTRVMTRTGMREYPKSRKSHRSSPVPEWLIPKLSTLMVGRPRDALVFTSPMGGPVDDSRFRHRIWTPAVKAAGLRPVAPRILRHTAASWLVIDGVPLYDVQALLGHESYATTQRYAHLNPDAHSKVVESWRRISDARARAKKKASGER